MLLTLLFRDSQASIPNQRPLSSPRSYCLGRVYGQCFEAIEFAVEASNLRAMDIAETAEREGRRWRWRGP